MSNTVLLLLFGTQLIALYFISRQTIKELFMFFRRFLPERAVLILITVLFLPGTIVHELAHFIMAVILMLHVREVSVLPEFEKTYIKLGKVIYEKKDVFRSILVGIAPIIIGLFFFWIMAVWKLFPNSNSILTIVLGYLIFIVSTTMFSSKQDLIDIVYIIPIGIIVAGVLFIFNINPTQLINNSTFVANTTTFFQQLNYYFLFSFAIHISIIILLKLFRHFKR